ncbi:MAG: rod shape-determining protein MreD [Deltaproteobacteria bacterium]|jgi:cell shape-determining protein MreD|nr:rod shape-determining protein MreD [Deltaproteobacteria bacterium]
MANLAKRVVPENPRIWGVVLLMALGLSHVAFAAAPGSRGLLSGIFAPDVSLMILVWLALRTEFHVACLGAFLFGFARDGLSLGPAGFYPSLLVLLAIAIGVLSDFFDFNRPRMAGILVFAVFGIVRGVFLPGIFFLLEGTFPRGAAYPLFLTLCLQGVSTALFAAIFFGLFDKLGLKGEA